VTELASFPVGRRLTDEYDGRLDLRPDDEVLLSADGQGDVAVGPAILWRETPPESRNYVFVIAPDTYRWDQVGSFRNGVPITPEIDAFKQDAVVFDNAFSQSSWTLPAFVSFFTGLHEFRHQILRDSFITPDQSYLIEPLAARFCTVNFNGGTWLGWRHGTTRFFDVHAKAAGTTDRDSGRTTFTRAKHFIDRNPVPDLFMFLHTYQTHSPYEPDEPYLRRLDPQARHRSLSAFTLREQYKPDVDNETRKALETLYAAEMMQFDDDFGQFISYLKSRRLYDRSMIIFLSDHGEEFYDHQAWFHGHTLYDELIRVPLYVKLPDGAEAGRHVKDSVGLVDVLPTILDWYRVPAAMTIDGRSLVPCLHDQSLHRPFLVSSATGCRFMAGLPPRIALVMDGRYKLIYNYPVPEFELKFYGTNKPPIVRDQIELYDIVADPREARNLADAHPEIVARALPEIGRILPLVDAYLKKVSEHKTRAPEDEDDQEQLKALGYL